MTESSKLPVRNNDNPQQISAADAEKHYLEKGTVNPLSYRYQDLDVLIYSTGKTGGTTLANSFRKRGMTVGHLHYNFPGFDRVEAIVKEPRKHKLLMLTAYREPVAQCLSMFFQNTNILLKITDDELLQKDVEWLKEQVNIYALELSGGIMVPQPFVANSLQDFDGTNIFTKPFNREEGFTKLETDRVQILVLRFDKISNWQRIIRTQTAYTDFVLVPENITAAKKIGELYKRVRDSIVIPKLVLDRFYQQEAANMAHLYTPSEIADIKNIWYKRL